LGELRGCARPVAERITHSVVEVTAIRCHFIANEFGRQLPV
jgi:hypothetical protein